MSDIDDLNNDTAKAAGEIMYPDGEGGPVQIGFDGQPTSRPAGYESSTEGTGIPNGVQASDLPGMDGDTRRTLNQWLTQQTNYNITPAPESSGFGDGTIDTTQANHKFVDPATIATVYSQDPNSGLSAGMLLNKQQLPYGPRGSANMLLKDVAGTAGDGSFMNSGESGMATDVGRTSEVLRRNRFNPGKSYTMLGPERRQADSNASPPSWSDTQKFHRQEKTVASTFGKYGAGFDGLAMTELQLVAEQLLFNAVGDKKTSFGKSGTFDAGSGSPLPAGNSTQLGRGRTKFVADQDFRPAYAIKAVLTKDRTNTTNINGAAAGFDLPMEDLKENLDHVRGSYGVLNNPSEPFRPGLPLSMIFLAAVGALASLIVALVISAVLDVLGVLVSLAGGTIPPGNGLTPYPIYKLDPSNPDPSKLPMGQAFGDDDYGNTDFFSALSKWLNIPALEAQYPIEWLTCLTATTFGALEFFIGNAFSRVAIPQILTNAAGYYVVVIRNAMRDMEQITNAFDNMGEGAGPVEGFFALIEAFTSSATFKFVTTLMQIGDRMLCGPGLGALTDRDTDNPWLPNVLPENDPGPVLIGNLHSSIRRKSDDSRLAYSFTSLPQVYIRPKEEFNRTTQNGLSMTRDKPSPLQDFQGDFDLATRTVANFGDTDVLFDSSIYLYDESTKANVPFYSRLTYMESGKIPTKFREEMEGLLNAYYVPFYFHDLRTNEIMPLPAFVESISDTFSPSWNEQKGFGRGDPVQIYGGTTRKIGFSFYMVATNKSDYSALYYGINKLVSMVYPQYSGGATIQNAMGQSFKKPYSMIQAASPLVRIRLGELFASNRTTETVRRLFGANERGFAIGQTDDDPPEPIVPDSSEPPWNQAALETVRWQAKVPVQPNAYDLMQATNIISRGKPVNAMFNFAGCNADGQGGALNMDGNPFLLPAGTTIEIPSGKYSWVSWEGTRFKVHRTRKFRLEPLDRVVVEIANYCALGGKGKVARPVNGGHLKNKLYYICKASTILGGEDGMAADATATERKMLEEAGARLKDDQYTAWQDGGSYIAVSIDQINEFKGRPAPSLIPPFPPPPPPEIPVTDSAFFQGNLLVEAMRESGGSGLAGAITSLDFDWNQAPWETDPGLGRAPTWVKVSIAFSPIHDEPLGLNSDGSLRAGAYPVGKLYEKVFGKRFSLPGVERRLSALASLAAPPPPPPPPEGSAGQGDLE